jgi:hypothetical protein
MILARDLRGRQMGLLYTRAGALLLALLLSLSVWFLIGWAAMSILATAPHT